MGIFKKKSKEEPKEERARYTSIFPKEIDTPVDNPYDVSSFIDKNKKTTGYVSIFDEQQPEEQKDETLSAFSVEEKKKTSIKERALSSLGSFAFAPTGLVTSLFMNKDVQERGRKSLESIAGNIFTTMPDAAVALTQQSVANMSEYEYSEAFREVAINAGVPESEIDEELIRIKALEKNKAITFHLDNLINLEGIQPEKSGTRQAYQVVADNARSSIEEPVNFFSNQNFEKAITGLRDELKKNPSALGLGKHIANMLKGDYANKERIDIFESTTKKELKKLQEKWNISEDDLMKQQKEAYKKSLDFVRDVQEGSEYFKEAQADRLDLANDKVGAYIHQAAGGVTSLAISLGIFAATKNPNIASLTAASYFSIIDNDNFDDSVARAKEANPEMSQEEAEKAVAQAAGTRRFSNAAIGKVGFGLLFKRFEGGKLLNFAKGTIEQLSEEVLQNSASNYLENKYYNKNKKTLDGTIDTILYSFPTALFGGGITSYGGFNYQEREEIAYQKEQAAELFVKNHGITKEDAVKIVDKIGGVMDNSVSQFQDYIKVNPERRYGPAQEFEASDVALSETGQRTTEQLIADSENKEAQSLLPMVIEPTGLGEGKVFQGNGYSVRKASGGTVQQANTDYGLQRRMEFAMQNSQYSQLLDKAEKSSSFEDFLDSSAVVFDDGDINIEFDNLKNPNVITIKEQGNQRGQITLSDESLAISGFTGRRIENIANESGMSNVDVYRKVLPLLGEDGLIINKIDPVPNGFNYVNLAGDQMLLMNTPDTNVNPVDFLRSAWKKKYFKEQVARTTEKVDNSNVEQDTTEPGNIIDYIKKNEGITISMNDGSMPAKGFSVATSKTNEFKVLPEDLTKETLKSYLLDNAETLRNEDRYLGAWFQDGYYWFDTPVVLQDKQDALEVARQNDQEGIFDLETYETLYTKDYEQRKQEGDSPRPEEGGVEESQQRGLGGQDGGGNAQQPKGRLNEIGDKAKTSEFKGKSAEKLEREGFKDEPSEYNQMSIEEDQRLAMEYIAQDPNLAYNIAVKNIPNTLPGTFTETSFYRKTIDFLTQKGEYQKALDVRQFFKESNLRAGREVVANRSLDGKLDAMTFADTLMQAKLSRITNKSLSELVTDTIDAVSGRTVQEDARKSAQKKRKEKVEKMINSKSKMSIEEEIKLLESVIC